MRLLWKDVEMGCGEQPAGKVYETVVERRGDGMWGTTSRQSICRLLCGKTWRWDVGNNQQARWMRLLERRGDGMWGTTSRHGGCRDLLVVEDQTKTQDLIMHRISLCTQSKSPTGWGFTVEQTADSHTPSDTIRQRMTHHQTEDDRPSVRGRQTTCQRSTDRTTVSQTHIEIVSKRRN